MARGRDGEKARQGDAYDLSGSFYILYFYYYYYYYYYHYYYY